MALFFQSFNNQFAKQFKTFDVDLIDNLTIHSYNIDVYNKREDWQFHNTLLIDLFHQA